MLLVSPTSSMTFLICEASARNKFRWLKGMEFRTGKLALVWRIEKCHAAERRTPYWTHQAVSTVKPTSMHKQATAEARPWRFLCQFKDISWYHMISLTCPGSSNSVSFSWYRMMIRILPAPSWLCHGANLSQKSEDARLLLHEIQAVPKLTSNSTDFSKMSIILGGPWPWVSVYKCPIVSIWRFLNP